MCHHPNVLENLESVSTDQFELVEKLPGFPVDINKDTFLLGSLPPVDLLSPPAYLRIQPLDNGIAPYTVTEISFDVSNLNIPLTLTMKIYNENFILDDDVDVRISSY